MPMPAKPEGMQLGHHSPEERLGTLLEIEEEEGTITPPSENPEWHPYATSFYRSIKQSPMRKVYTKADWMQAWLAADFLDAILCANVPYRAGQMAEWRMMCDSLLLTVGARRRLKVQLLRAGVSPGKSAADVAKDELSKMRKNRAKTGVSDNPGEEIA